MAEKLITPPVRGWFVALDKPKLMKGAKEGDEPRFQMLMPLDKKDKFWKQAEKMVVEAAKEKWGKVPPKFKSPIKDGDDEAEEYPDLANTYFINAGNTRKPGVVDEDLDPIMDAGELYSGAWYRCSLTCYAWEHPTGGKGASFSLNNVMKIKDDERLDGGTTAEQDFAGFAKRPSDDDDDDGDDDESLLG